MDMIKAEDIHVSFKNLEVLKGVSLSVKPQEVVCIIGPSGAGKSTFLRALNHLEHIKNGKIYIEDQLLTHHENGVRKLKINSKKWDFIVKIKAFKDLKNELCYNI